MLASAATLNRTAQSQGPEVGMGQCGYSSMREQGEVRLFLQGGGYQLGVILPLGGHLVMSGDIFGCRILGRRVTGIHRMGTRDAAQHPPVPRTAPR